MQTNKTLFPNNPILSTKNFEVAQDWEVPILGFFVIGAFDKSMRSFADFSDEQVQELALLIKKVRSAMKTVLFIDDVYVFQNEDTDHGFHVWLFPRHQWMEEFGRKIQSVRPIMESAVAHRATAEEIDKVNYAADKMKTYFFSNL